MQNWTKKYWEIFFQIYECIPRGGPGDNASTEKAFRVFKDLTSKPRILDVGSGPGVQTIHLAKISKGEIWATDNHKPFLDILEKNASCEGQSQHIKTCCQDMTKLNVEKNYFDLIWAEGSIYFFGYENALREWKSFFRGKPRFAFSEPNYFKEKPPKEVRDLWETDYPSITLIPETIKRIEKQGYHVLHHFKLPEDSWRKEYYAPLKKTATDVLNRNASSIEVQEVTKYIFKEILDYEKYSDWYGYTFYICES